MSIKAAEVKNIAALARLAIADRELEGYAGQLSSILALVEQMNAADLDAVEPLAHPLDMTQRLRPDDPETVGVDQRQRYQSGAPAAEDGFYLVPKVIE